MAVGFSDIPDVVIDYVRQVFGRANDKVSRTLTDQPSFHEPFLDGVLVGELSAAPPAFFAAEQIGLEIETHFLGSRWMDGRFEIADIAFSVTLRQRGQLELRKVALLQTKRLYSREIPVTPADPADFRIGIGRLIDRPEPSFPLSRQRRFRFDEGSTYDALSAGSEQCDRIDSYMKTRDLPVYYGLYNPLAVPFEGAFPPAPEANANLANRTGCRIIPAREVHTALEALPEGRSPSFKGLVQAQPLDAGDPASIHGWRLERFVADEVLRCRQGRLYDRTMHPSLYDLLYARGAPITAAIAITIDFGADAPS
ncbi:MAG: hypothetical protein AB1942_24965 [Pseudomonadota bacterium]